MVLAEASLAALAHTDRPAETLPDLLAHAGDDRARVALYAAGRAAAYARPSRLRALLAARTAPGTGKVTSRKETVRLAAVLLPPSDAAALLADAYAQPDQHSDVRAACVASGTALLGDERMWEVLADAATGGRALRTAVLRTQPAELAPGHRPRYAELVRTVCGSDDDELLALGYNALVRWLLWAPGAATVLVEALTDPDRRGAWRSAAYALAGAAPATERTPTRCTRPWWSWPLCTPADPLWRPGPRRPSVSAPVRLVARTPVIRRPCWSSWHGWPGPATRPRGCSPPN
ncbi:hypothetical protein AB0387_30735 [Streptomyces sp. NPDC089173]|uniref:hypothetical protein n=1 Tax=Streptomyces sp. NPDC089173 TaxID=3154965 RepID=UPI0034505A97